MEWDIWRIYSSTHFKDSLSQISNEWSLDDLLDAHMLLDAQEAAEARARSMQESAMKGK